MPPGGGQGPTRGLPRLPLAADVPDRPPDGHPLPLGQGEGRLPSLAHERPEGRAYEHFREASTAAAGVAAAAAAAPAAPAGPAAEEAPASEARECERQSGDEGALGRVQRARDGDDRHQGRKVRELCYKGSLFGLTVRALFYLFVYLFFLILIFIYFFFLKNYMHSSVRHGDDRHQGRVVSERYCKGLLFRFNVMGLLYLFSYIVLSL